MKKPARHTITAALPYANGPVHIGHLAGVYVPADIYARYLRLKGEDVAFICGSDEHGVPITLQARNRGITPQEVVDQFHNMIKKSFEEFGISFDIYSRTSNKIHHETSKEFFKEIHKNGLLEERRSSQFYDEVESQFLADRYITGTCPRCSHPEAYGDQCENCGNSLSPNELINPKSVLSGSEPIQKDTTHWYLPLNDYQERLEKWILKEHKEWKSNVYGQCKSWLDQELRPRAMTRDLDWGVEVPLPEGKGKVMYVWFDAPIGYISATKEWAKANNKDWEPYWKDEETELIHFIGKDNIVFHCIIFPSILMAKGDYILPENVPANEFLNLEGRKISTSRNWAVWLHEYLEDFPGKSDVLRYVLTATAPETKDNDFTWKDFQDRNNNELVAILGNFINRVLVLSHKYFEGKVPECANELDIDRDLQKFRQQAPKQLSKSLDKFRFREALAEFINLARAGNKYLADTEPWKLAKTDMKRVGEILNNAIQLVATISIAGEPFLPETSSSIRKLLSINESQKWDEAGKVIVPAGTTIQKPELLFAKIENDEIEKQIQKLTAKSKENSTKQSTYKPIMSEIQFDDFAKVDLRIGTIIEAEKVPKTDKLLQLQVDIGVEKRTIVSGIAEYYDPTKIIGEKVVVVANLAPKKLRGIESKGMILMAEDENGKLSFVSPENGMPHGSIVR